MLYSNTIDGVQWQELNRTPFSVNPNTVDGRGQDRADVSRDYQSVILLTNTSEGYSFNATGQLQKQIGQGALPRLGGSVSYTFGQVKDIKLGDLEPGPIQRPRPHRRPRT